MKCSSCKKQVQETEIVVRFLNVCTCKKCYDKCHDPKNKSCIKKLIERTQNIRKLNISRYSIEEMQQLRQLTLAAIKTNAVKTKFIELLGCTVEECRKYLEKQFKEGMSWDNHGEWHIDHIIPVVWFLDKDKKTQKKCHHYTNFQPLWAKENLQKSSKYKENQYVSI